MTIEGKKRMWSLLRMLLPVVGFSMTCGGAYLMSLQGERTDAWSTALAYTLIACSFPIILVGVFLTICQSMTTKMYQRRGLERQIRVYTTDRPSSYPPTYEESQIADARQQTECVVEVDGVHVELNLAPPLYTRDGSQTPDCSWSWERPPPYRQAGAEERGEMVR